MQHLPPESAWARSELGGFVESERVAVVGLSLQYLLARAWSSKPDEFPDLEDFFPATVEEVEPEPRAPTFDDWVAAVMPMAR